MSHNSSNGVNSFSIKSRLRSAKNKREDENHNQVKKLKKNDNSTCSTHDHCRHPDWFPINQYLHCNQRHATGSYKDCIKSSFEDNSEACNIWTHFACAVITVYLWYEFISLPSGSFTNEGSEKFVTSVMYFGMTVCFSFSTLFHVFYCHSEYMYDFTLRMDLVGITLSIVGCCIPYYYYSFYHDVTSQIIYGIFTAIFTLISITFSTSKEYLKDECVAHRAVALASIVVVSLVAYIHVCIRDGFFEAWDMGHRYFIYLILIDIIGIGILLDKFPEKYFKIKYEAWIHSHPIFHVVTFLSALSGYMFTHVMRQQLVMTSL